MDTPRTDVTRLVHSHARIKSAHQRHPTRGTIDPRSLPGTKAFCMSRLAACVHELAEDEHRLDPPSPAELARESLDALDAAESAWERARTAAEEQEAAAALEVVVAQVVKDTLHAIGPRVRQTLSACVDKLNSCAEAQSNKQGPGAQPSHDFSRYARQISGCLARLEAGEWRWTGLGYLVPIGAVRWAVGRTELACQAADEHQIEAALRELTKAVRALLPSSGFTDVGTSAWSLGRLDGTGAARAHRQARLVAALGLNPCDPA